MPTNKKLMNKNMNIDANAASLKLFDHDVKRGIKRDYLGIALHGNNVNTKNVKRGMYVVKQSKGKNAEEIKSYWRFKCNIEFFESECGNLDAQGNGGDNDDFIGRSTPISEGFSPVCTGLYHSFAALLSCSFAVVVSVERQVFHWYTADQPGKIEKLPEEKNGVVMPGETVNGITVCLPQSAVLWKDLKFIVREAGRTIGAGIVTETIDM